MHKKCKSIEYFGEDAAALSKIIDPRLSKIASSLTNSGPGMNLRKKMMCGQHRIDVPRIRPGCPVN
jgi:hypothetical protein